LAGLQAALRKAEMQTQSLEQTVEQKVSQRLISIISMAEAADVRLLRAVVASDAHVLRQFFPPVAKRTYNLRPRKHPVLHPPKDDHYFVSRILFK